MHQSQALLEYFIDLLGIECINKLALSLGVKYSSLNYPVSAIFALRNSGKMPYIYYI